MQRVLRVPQDWVPPVCLFHYFKVCAVFLEKTKSSNEESFLRCPYTFRVKSTTFIDILEGPSRDEVTKE